MRTFNMTRMPKEWKNQLRKWRPKKSTFVITRMSAKSLMFEDPSGAKSLKYGAFVNGNGTDRNFEYWKKRLQKSPSDIMPVVVERISVPEHGTWVWVIRDGLHRSAACEFLGIKEFPVLAISRSLSETGPAGFSAFTDSELDNLWNGYSSAFGDEDEN